MKTLLGARDIEALQPKFVSHPHVLTGMQLKSLGLMRFSVFIPGNVSFSLRTQYVVYREESLHLYFSRILLYTSAHITRHNLRVVSIISPKPGHLFGPLRDPLWGLKSVIVD